LTRDEILSRLQAVFRKAFGDPALSVSDRTTAADVPDWTSLRHVDLIVAVEQEFAVRFSTREVRQLENVGSLVDLIARKK
jgi:acyl carrier protein